MPHPARPELEKVKRLLQYVSFPIIILVVWQLLFYLGYIKPITLPPPSMVIRTLWEMSRSGDLARHIGISIVRVLEGFGIAAFLGLGLGTVIGLSRTMDRLSDLIIQVIKPIPPIAWIPLAILWFGIGEQSKVYIIFLGAFFPIIVSTIDGIRQTDHKFVEVARILEVPRSKLIRQVVIPGAFPAIMTGLRVGLMVAWMCVVAAELIAASSGIGYLIMDARQLSQSDVVLVGMISIGVIGKIMDSLIKQLEARLITWKTSFAGG
ncbi:MAG: putative aliphatic sulfonates transport permease protein SsuC [Syntrophorhabdaceae bacterium PtaU1.Bin034]|nr:MAG: putative aliphatic sulfonates transport permease protein SsuC [Syntrophorhabdaceae bacterium PtaU1.Bin034]